MRGAQRKGGDLERIAFNLIQIECDPRQASRWECGGAFDRLNPIKRDTL
jgi:hypothetical protein